MSEGSPIRKFFRRLFLSKSYESLVRDAQASEMKRHLTGLGVMMIGIGEIIGAGIFVITGTAAANHAGPSIVISFIIAGFLCTCAGFCYAEMASIVPISGSAYTYTYATMGELMGWIIGWDLMLEYIIGAATVSAGWSGYFVKMLIHFGVDIDPKGPWVTAPWQTNKAHQIVRSEKGIINLPAVLITLLCTSILVKGIKESSTFNNVFVVIKTSVVLLFIAATFPFINTDNWKPFVPPASDDGNFGGFNGIIAAATQVFFAYIGFDAVSTTAQETKNPKRDMPIGILGSLLVCTVLYILTSLNLTGVRHYSELGGSAPLAEALSNIPQLQWLAYLVDIGAVAGLTSVILISLMGQPRIFHAMATDGLLPPFFSRLHPRFKTPYITTIMSGVFCAAAGGLFPVDILGDLTSSGTLFAFALVCLSVMVLRFTRPDLPRPFRVPLGPVVIPLVGAAGCFYLIVANGAETVLRVLIWLGAGLLVYFGYGYRHSKLGHAGKELKDSHFEMEKTDKMDA
ncbi:amino acid/polyamine/organocation transporter, APC superfamily [Paraphysoderma sedebokerense]|nr:amino acid/polyamine/organocation transporter, APC superfamily [Paraphysoderma sedebokerense]